MDANGLLVDLYDRIPGLVRSSLDGIDSEALTRRLTPDANTVAWLLWHQARVQDHQILAGLAGEEQLWVTGRFAPRFGLDADPDDIGFGHTPEQVASVRPDGHGAIIEYADAVAGRVVPHLEGLSPDDLDRIVDDSYDPPVTAGVRLVSVAADCHQHLGQAAYLRGLLMGQS